MKILCVFGRNNYGDSARGLGYEYRNFIPAIKKMGHDVVHFDSWDRNLYCDFAELNKALLDYIQRESPDIAFFVPMLYEVWLETLNVIRHYTDVKTICWCADDSWKFPQVSRFIANSYDLIVTTYSNILNKYQKKNINNVLYSQWAADSTCYCQPLPSSECLHDVVFIGSAHGNRINKVKFLQSHGINVEAYGYGWPNGPVSGDDIPKLINNSKITLNFSNSKGPDQLKARIFEVPGYGGFLLTEKTPELSNYYKPSEEVEVVSSLQNMVDKINFYLKNPMKRDQIAQAAYIRTIKDHSYEKRFNEIIDAAKSMSSRNPKSLVGSLSSQIINDCRDHQAGPLLSLVKKCCINIKIPGVSQSRKMRFFRRAIFEISWRLGRQEIFCARGLPGKIFYDQS